MVAVTYGVARTAVPAKNVNKSGKKQKGLFTRFYDALIESRMRAAEREIAMHRHLLWRSEKNPLGRAKLPFLGQ